MVALFTQIVSCNSKSLRSRTVNIGDPSDDVSATKKGRGCDTRGRRRCVSKEEEIPHSATIGSRHCFRPALVSDRTEEITVRPHMLNSISNINHDRTHQHGMCLSYLHD